MFLLIAGTWLRVVEDRTLTHIAAAAALIAFLVSIFLARRKQWQARHGHHPPSANNPQYPVHVWPTMTPGYSHSTDQPYMTAVPMRSSSQAYANQPPPGPPPPEEDPFKPELFSGLPAEAPPSYVEAQAAVAPVQAPEPAYPNGHRSTAHFAADAPAGPSTSAAPAAAAATAATPTTPAPAATTTTPTVPETAAPAATTTTPTVPETAAPAQTAPTEPATASKAPAAESTTPTATQSSSA